MKLNLLLDNQHVLPNYQNINPISSQLDPYLAEHSSCHCLPLTDLALADDGEVEEIRAVNCLSYYPLQEVPNVLKHWLSKLRHGGTISIMDLDLHEVFKAFGNRTLSFEAANSALYKYRKSVLTAHFVRGLLQQAGYDIIRISFQNYSFTIIGARP